VADQLDDAFFRSLFHSQLGGIAIADLETLSIVDINEVLLEILGRTRDQIIDIPHVWRELTPPEYHSLDEQAIGEVLEHGYCDPFDKEYVRPDGTRVPVRVSSAAVDGYPGKLIVFVTDISHEHATRERERAIQQRLEIALSAAEQGVWDFDLLTGEMVYSDRAKQIYGLPADQPVTFEQIRDATHPEDYPFTSAQLQRSIDPAIRERKSYEYRILRPDGSTCWALAFGEAVFEGPPGAERAVRYIGTLQDITARKQAERHQQLLIAELNHRVKNTLAVVQALAHQSLGKADVPPAAFHAFQGRLRALAAAHDILTRESWDAASMHDLAAAVLQPHSNGDGRIRFDGEKVRLTPQVAVNLAIAIHELATNASKYGALSTDEGWVDMNWKMDGDEPSRIHIHWREDGGPKVSPPDREGFGMRIIRRALASELRGEVQLDFHPSGIECSIRAPAAGPLQ
jgi:PAS domain S-box-containing protein